MWHPKLWRRSQSQSSQPRLLMARALWALDNQLRSPNPARWLFSVWSQPPWLSARCGQDASNIVQGLAPLSAELMTRAERGLGPRPGVLPAMEHANDKFSQPAASARSVPPLSPAEVTHSRPRHLKAIPPEHGWQ